MLCVGVIDLQLKSFGQSLHEKEHVVINIWCELKISFKI